MHAIRGIGKFGYVSIALAFDICLIYAILDEVHQLFVPGRSAEVRDVLIDSAGAAVGISVCWMIMKLKLYRTPAESD